MANETRVDLLLRLRTALEGDKEATAYLDGFANSATQGARHVSDEWDKLRHKLERKFSLPDIGYELLRGFGAGSGFALIARGVDAVFNQFEARRKQSEAAVKSLDDLLNMVKKKSDEISDKRLADHIDNMNPSARIAERAKEIAHIDRAMEALRGDKALNEAQQARVNSPSGKIAIEGGTIGRSFLLAGMPHQDLMHDMEAWSNEMAKDLAKIALQMNELTAKRDELGRSSAKDAKDLEAARQKEKDDAHITRVKTLTDVLDQQEKGFDDLIEKQKKSNDAWDATGKAADAIRAQASEEEKYKQQVKEINALRGVDNGLTNQEADAAIARLDAERQIAAEKRKDTALSDQLAGIESQRAEIENNHLLTRQEANAQLLPLLQQQNDLIAARIKLLTDEAAAAQDPKLVAQLKETINRLQKELAAGQGKITGIQTNPTLGQSQDIALRDMGVGKNADGSQAKVDPSKHYTSATDGFGASLKQQIAEIGTFGDQINRAFAQMGQSIRTNLGSAFADMVLKAGSFKSKVVGFGNAIATSFVQITAQMAADWIYQHTIMAAWKKLFTAQDVATTAAAEGTKVGVVAAGQGGQTAAHGAGATARGAISVGETIFHGIQVAIRTAAHIGGEILKTAVTIAQSAIRIGAVIAESIVYVIEAAVGALAAMSSIPYVGPFLGLAAMGAVLAAGMGLVKREMGGPVTAGQPYLVGEKRPEIFVPHTDGFIIPSVAQAMTRPGYAPPSGGGSGGGGQAGGGGGGRNLQIALVDNRAGRERIERHPHNETYIMEVVQKHRRKLGIRT